LAPAFAASGFQRELDVCESLVDLGVDVLRDPGRWGGQVGVGVPTACKHGDEVSLVVVMFGDGSRSYLALRS